MQWNLSIGHADNSNLTEKMDCSVISHSSSSSNSKTSTDTLLFPKGGDHVESRLTMDQPALLQNASYLTPFKMESERNLSYEISASQTPPPVDFSTVTTADFGIGPESFTMPSKGGSQSRVNQLKRRSTIGVRGSPENNSLIRYIARQRREKKQNTFSEANLFARQNTLLKAKIAAFQSSFKILEETEEKGICISNTSKEGKTTPSEPSELGQLQTSRREKIALENNVNYKSMTGARKSAGVQSSTIASLSEKTLSFGMGAFSKLDLVELPSKWMSTGVHHEFPSPLFYFCSKGMNAVHANEELNSCKKVRFAEKQRLEIFDNTKPPVTPLQSCLPSSSLRRERGTEWFSNNCESLQAERSTRTKGEVKQYKEDLDSDRSDTYLPEDIPSCSEGQVPFSPSVATEEGFPNVTPIKQSFSQPNFDDDDKDPGSLEVAVKPECSTIPDLQETNNSPLDLQATCTRKTRSCTKGKCVSETAKTKLCPANKPQTKKNPKRKSGEFEKDNSKATSSHKKAPATRRKVFGKRRKRKSEKKPLSGQREMVSKIPLLSPIPEVKEEISMVLSHQSMPATPSSFLDDSNSSLLQAESASGAAENGLLCFAGDHNNHLLDRLNREDVVASPSSRLQDGAVAGTRETVPPDSPESSSPEKPSCASQENKLELENGDTPNEAMTQTEVQLLNLGGTDGNNKAKGDLPFRIGSETDPIRGSDAVDFKKRPRRSSRLTCCPSSIEAFQPEASEKDVAGNNPEGIPPVAAESTLLKNTEDAAEDRSRKVRRSMRQHKDTENEGLVWVQIPADDHARGQGPLGSASKARRRRPSSSLLESEPLSSKESPLRPIPLSGE
ncbi:hypothetical protein JRQ81_011070 [Phrynocephalus forsythii]|uniref:Cell division cycle-associated protein 2 n=1 Tax=Phrynocephalus forsythii TaxID=171643 RepID=A0A9Q1AQZ1_9SAUR|nr:hypothetical protein JRQ81_011070 [Phrynocephalus forsythii]